MLRIDEIRIDDRAVDLVTDSASPALSFSLESNCPDTSFVRATVELDGRVQEVTRQIGIPLAGLRRAPFCEHRLRIVAHDNHGETAEGEALFRTGRLDTPWSASWITDPNAVKPKKQSPAPLLFARDFKISKPVRRALITATAIGIFELWLNGKRVGSDYFAPGFTSYKHTLQYELYDVGDLLGERNTLTALVGAGWAVGRFTYENKVAITDYRQGLLLELFLFYEDGSSEVLRTDGSWRVTADGPTRFGDFYDGETYDATVDPDGVHWSDAKVYAPPIKPEIALANSHVREYERIKPISCVRAKSGEVIYDFGQNLAGVLSLKLNGRAGQRIVIRHGEVLSDGELYTESLRTAKQMLTYICRDGVQEYTPRLTYMGFRYASMASADPEDVEIEAVVLHSDFEESGSFDCSDPQLNRLQQNVIWSGRSNFVEVPTDCPQRDERQGWTGDMSIFADTACFNFDLGTLLEKWLRDMRSEQGLGGGIPLVVPKHGNSAPSVAIACWGDSCVIVPWAEYMARGNIELLRRSYPAMKRFLRAAKHWSWLSGPGRHSRRIWKRLYQLGDWCAPQGDVKEWMSRGKWIATAYFAHSCDIVSKVAKLIGKEQDSVYYASLREEICEAYLHVFTDGNGRLKEEFQTGYVLPLAFGMVSGETRKKMADNLDRLVRENGCRLSTGFPGTPYLLFALADCGHVNTAWELLTQENCPSWLYQVKMGATTFWEQWDAITPEGVVRDPSMNHYAYGAVGAFLYRRLAGIEPIEGGYRRFAVRPIVGGLTKASASVKTRYGRAAVEWETADGEFRITVTVPVSTACELTMPSGRTETLSSGTHTFSEAIGG